MKKLMIASAAAIAAIGMAAAPAMAVPPSNIDVGGATEPQNYQGVDGDGIIFTAGGQVMTCETSTVQGVITPGATSWLPDTFATVDASQWTGCLGPAGIPLTVEHVGSWNLGIDSDTTGGVTHGGITNIQAHVSNPDGLCDFDVTNDPNDPDLSATFDESTQTLSTDPTDDSLVVSNVVGCLGLIVDGDRATFEGDYHITDTSDVEFPVTITNS